MQHVFIVGSKGIPGEYGGYETFVDKITEYCQNNRDIKYHVACKADENGEFEYHNARCFKIKVLNIGAAKAILYDVLALCRCCKYIEKHNIMNPIIYILACRLGPFFRHFYKRIHNMGGKVLVNPDGHEWMRAKWSIPVKKYWKMSEYMMVKNADLLICDSKNIEKYIQETYKHYKPNTTFIAYGADTRRSVLADDDIKLINWYKEKKLSKGNYYLVVGRFVPENNYEIMIREFMQSKSTHDFALITNVSEKFLDELKAKTEFHKDKRIKFVGTVYDKEMLKKIRENAYGYLHGHEVGGTNPSLLESLGSTDLNLLLDVSFNKEVAETAALYWTKESGDLAKLIKITDAMSKEKIAEFGNKAKNRIANKYSWKYIVDEYVKLFQTL